VPAPGAPTVACDPKRAQHTRARRTHRLRRSSRPGRGLHVSSVAPLGSETPRRRALAAALRRAPSARPAAHRRLSPGQTVQATARAREPRRAHARGGVAPLLRGPRHGYGAVKAGSEACALLGTVVSFLREQAITNPPARGARCSRLAHHTCRSRHRRVETPIAGYSIGSNSPRAATHCFGRCGTVESALSHGSALRRRCSRGAPARR
jgi:hypothetical protein